MAQSRRVEDAKEWLETRLRNWVSQARGQATGDPDASGLDVVKLHEEGRYREAEVAARRLVDSLRATRGERHPHFATALSNLALSLQKQGNHTAAGPLLRQALDIRRETLGEGHPHYATALNNLALLLCEQRDLAAAEPLMRQALDIRREALGERHPDHATGLTSLAMLLCERGDFVAAEPLLRQALDIRRETLGDHHPHYATALNNLALLLRERGDFAGAAPLLQHALDIRRATLGEQHPDTRVCASALESLHRPTEPEPPFRPAARENRFPEEPEVQPLRDEANNLAARFARVSEQMAQAVDRMRTVGLPPDEHVLEAAAACRRDFARLRAEVFRLAESVRIGPPETIGLPALSALLDSVAAARAALRRHQEIRGRALDLTDQVCALTSRGGSYGESLAGLHSHAGAIREAIDSSPALTLPPDAERLVAGEHPLAALLHLAHGARELDDADWADLFTTVSDAFGRPAAVALARGKIFRAEPSPNPNDAPAASSS
ncbi:MAG: tetratricopeptide repeat protein [Isosphaeraceae bacterium]|nr:tetratricopeptide repeat protein [Isosphaeraceae bacterium]